MARGRFSAILKRVRLWITGKTESEARGPLGHQFNADASPIGAIGHQFSLGSGSSSALEQQFNISGIRVTGSVAHQFTVFQIDTSSLLVNQFNVSHINTDFAISHRFGIAEQDFSIVGHEFFGRLTAQSYVSHQLTVSAINTISPLGHSFIATDITISRAIAHRFGVHQDLESIVGHKYSLVKTTAEAVSHSVNVDRVHTSSRTSHQFNAASITKSRSLGHSFGFQLDDTSRVGHTFGYEVPQLGLLGHAFNIYGIIRSASVSHQFNVNEIQNKLKILGHQFSLTEDSLKVLGHRFLLAYKESSTLAHLFNVPVINSKSTLGHQFNLNRARHSLGHVFSAIGAGILYRSLGHEYNLDFILPSWRVGQQFNVKISLDLPSETITGDFSYLPEESSLAPFDILNQIERTEHLSYANPHNTAASSGTWHGIDPDQVIAEKRAGLSEANYLLGSFLFENEPENLETHDLYLIKSDLTTWPEYESDTIFEFQAWNYPVITEGDNSWWNINDFPIRLGDCVVEPGGNPFPVFFGRQITISGELREFVGTFGTGEYPEGLEGFDPFGRVSITNQEEPGDPLVFNSYSIEGSHNFILEKELMISGIYISQPNGEPGAPVRPNNTDIRLGFTDEQTNIQPEELIWELGINQLPDTYTYKQETDQWILNGKYRDFTVPKLRGGDNVCGRITARSLAKTTNFTGVIPADIIQQTIDDAVRVYGAGTFIWPDINDEESMLQLCIEIEQLSRRTRIPSGITIRYEGVNSKGKIIKFSREASNLKASYIEIPSNTIHNDRIDTLVINKINPASQLLSSTHISKDGISVYRKEGQNSVGKIVIIDEEAD